jgi:hypothetical protein
MEVRKDRAILPHAISPTAFLPIFKPKNPLMMDPINGYRGIRQANFSNIPFLPF